MASGDVGPRSTSGSSWSPPWRFNLVLDGMMSSLGTDSDRPWLQGESWASSAGARKSFVGNRSRDTAPELAVRRSVHRLGLRYRTSFRPIPSLRRTADLVFTKARVVVFVDGCFWHGCPEHFKAPAAHAEYWEAKLARNQARDHDTDQALGSAGWQVIRVWEHDDPAAVALRIEAAVRVNLEDGGKVVPSGA
jgi:DNA mismatch endonuclease, patch repair protein